MNTYILQACSRPFFIFPDETIDKDSETRLLSDVDILLMYIYIKTVKF